MKETHPVSHHASTEGEGEGVRAGEEGAQEGVHGEQGARLLRRPPHPRSPLPLHRRLRLPQLQTQNLRYEKHRERKYQEVPTASGPVSKDTLIWLPEHHCNRIRNLKLG